MPHPYRHKQRGHVTLFAAVGAVSVVPILIFLTMGSEVTVVPWLILAGSLILILFVTYLFSSMTITIDENALRWSFGPGVIQKSEPLSEIAGAETTKTSWVEGLGIHLTARGWLYNVSGRSAVSIRLRDGKQFLLGTDEPERLAAAITLAIGPDQPLAAAQSPTRSINAPPSGVSTDSG